MKFSVRQGEALRPILINNYWSRGGYMTLKSARNFMSDLLAYLRPGMKFLDLGCSPNVPYKEFIESSDAQWFGSDLHDASHVESLNYRQSADDTIPFPDEMFDIIRCFHVVEHFSNPEAMFAEIRCCLKPGGIFGGACAFHEFEHDSFFLLTHRGSKAISERHGFEILQITPSDHSGFVLEEQRFFGGCGHIDQTNTRNFIRSVVICNLNWIPFLICNGLEFARRRFLGRYYKLSKDCATNYFYARK